MIACYINLIRTTFTSILGGQHSHLQHVDQGTVEIVQLRAPGVSRLDSEFLRNEMELKHLFPEVQDAAVRDGILQRLLGTEHPIPSLYTLFKDLRYLDPAARAVKALLPEPAKGTIRQNLRFLYSPQEKANNSLVIQDSEILYTTISGNFNDRFDLAIRELFLCALRYFTDPAQISSKKDMNPIKQTVNAPKRFLGFKLLEFARQLGFKIQEVNGVLEEPGGRLLTDMLSNLPREIFKWDGTIPENLSVSFKEYLSKATITADSTLQPSITTIGGGEPLSQRCGRGCGGPVDDKDRVHLFLRKLHAPLSDFQQGGSDISSFYVKRCIYLAFFGPTHIPGTVEPSMSGGTREQDSEPAMDIGLGGIDQQLPDPVVDNPGPRPNAGLIELPQESRILNEAFSLRSALINSPQLEVTFRSVNEEFLYRVPFSRKGVEDQARLLAERGRSLMDERGHHWVWNQCYDVLVETETRTLIVVGSIKDHASVEDDSLPAESRMHKRRGQNVIGNRVNADDLVHKARGQHATIEEEDEL